MSIPLVWLTGRREGLAEGTLLGGCARTPSRCGGSRKQSPQMQGFKAETRSLQSWVEASELGCSFRAFRLVAMPVATPVSRMSGRGKPQGGPQQAWSPSLTSSPWNSGITTSSGWIDLNSTTIKTRRISSTFIPHDHIKILQDFYSLKQNSFDGIFPIYLVTLTIILKMGYNLFGFPC